MTFLKPFLLLGLLSAAIPIIIHLINKHRPRKQPFAAIELLKRSIERVERRLRLKRLLLLASRVALLAAFALAASGPLLGSEATTAAAKSGPRRIAIVLDASLSMRATYGDRTAFQRAKGIARGLVDALGPEDQAVVVAARAKVEVLTPRPTADRATLLKAIDGLDAGFDVVELSASVGAAAQALQALENPSEAEEEEAPPINARVVVLSDLSGHAFQSAADVRVGGRPAQLEVIDVLSGTDAKERINRALVSVDAVSVPAKAAGAVEIRTRVQSFAPQEGAAAPVNITLESGERALVQSLVEVVPGTLVEKVLEHAFETPGIVPVRVTLEPDHLREDDVAYVNVDVRKQVRSLVVDGAPSGVPKEDEIFYLERALVAGASDQAPPRVITVDDLSRTDLATFDVVIMAGVDTFPPAEGGRLVDFVEKGGGLLITASETLDIELYNSELGRILPRSFRGMKALEPSTGGLGASGLVTFSEPDLEHPVMEVFGADSIGGLLSSRTRGYLLLEPASGAPASVLFAYEDGQPALIERRAANGRVMVLTTSIDRDLSDLPIRPAFVPLMRRILLELGGALAKPDLRRTRVGDVRTINLPPATTSIVVTKPDAKELELPVGATETALKFEDTALPGHYQVRATVTGTEEPLEAENFAVNTDARESDLRPLSVDEATNILLGTASPEAAREDSLLSRAQALKGLQNPEAASSALLALMALAFLLESALSTPRRAR